MAIFVRHDLAHLDQLPFSYTPRPTRAELQKNEESGKRIYAMIDECSKRLEEEYSLTVLSSTSPY
jgi:hypothetical protein